MNTLRLLVSTALPATLMAMASPAAAALADADEASEGYSDGSADGDSATRSSRDIVVLGGIGFRNRENEAAEPTLVYGEEIFTTYGADLEIFVEKRIGERFTIRAVGSNLLDGSKDERFNKFNTIADQFARSFDEYELETETAGPVFQVIARLAF